MTSATTAIAASKRNRIMNAPSKGREERGRRSPGARATGSGDDGFGLEQLVEILTGMLRNVSWWIERPNWSIDFSTPRLATDLLSAWIRSIDATVRST
jgi:hypothetical protein